MEDRLLSTIIATIVGSVFVFTLAATALFGGAAAGTCPPARGSVPTGSPPAEGAGGASAGLDAEQLSNAAAIVATGADLGVPPRGWVIALAVAIQESGLRVLDHGDAAGPDSRGLFQQRTGWGAVTERMNPATSARLFYAGGHAGQDGLLDIPDWQSLPLTQAANAVQHSAYPDAYAAHEQDAWELVLGLWASAGTDTSPSARPAVDGAWAECTGDDEDTDPGSESVSVPASLVIEGSPAGRQAVAFALAQLGKPYRWAAAGPGAYDCSGLTMAAWAAAGQVLPHFTGAQVTRGTPVAGGLTQAAAGDLVFIPGPDGTMSQPRHVGMVAGYVPTGTGRQLWIVNAPGTGRPVQLVDAETWSGQVAAIRHIG